MADSAKDQINQWLKKLEQESWQLELLVSAFTIFLLIQANEAFATYYEGMRYQYNVNDPSLIFIYTFLGLLSIALKALTICLVIHLMLRGFWIGTIGLRSVQSNVNFAEFNYSEFFTEKLKKKVISLDQMVMILDQVCSVIFAFSFLVIALLISFGIYLVFLGGAAILLSSVVLEGIPAIIYSVFASAIMVTILLSGFVYLIDYFSLGFFKKFKKFSRIYYPFYRLYSFITLSFVSRSIYYYLIARFSKRRIRIVYTILIGFVLVSWFTTFDQFQYFHDRGSKYMSVNHYDDLRNPDAYIAVASIPSKIIKEPFIQIFLRYDPSYNLEIKSNCPDFVPEKNDGFNPRFKFTFENNGLNLGSVNYSDSISEKALECLKNFYVLHLNDSVYHNLDYYYYKHPHKGQKGLITMIPTQGLIIGKNELAIHKSFMNGDEKTKDELVTIPFWFSSGSN